MSYVTQTELNRANSLPYQFPSASENYIGDITFAEYCFIAQRQFSFLPPLIDTARVSGDSFYEYINFMNEVSWEFEDQDQGGRGIAYNLAQRSSNNRMMGTLSLLKCFSESQIEMPRPDQIILDALAGDGTITRLLQTERILAPRIISADLSSFMVKACLEQKFPCIRQSATCSLLRDSVLDGVLIAYGSHHLDKSSRMMASNEAFRTIKHGGRFVLHDFEIGTSTANWFDKVVHPYSRTGHPHRHFSREEMSSLLKDAGFKNIQIFSMSDPFILKGNSAEEARTNALMHVYHMYDLVRISNNHDEMLYRLEKYVGEILGGIQIERIGPVWTATIQRQALVAVGTKTV